MLFGRRPSILIPSLITGRSSRYPKHWLTVGDPAREFTMTQSAPLMVLPDPDEFVVVQVK
ncbi:phage major capsid E family protein [Escherichia coli 3-105-05_S3_C2]|nr:phage major capsid E family protein [Escherichia coli 3-105-05_S3_C1]KDT51011.1 phage major capsid E family protein [Escherichia coli 3-105-05_S3_C2]